MSKDQRCWEQHVKPNIAPTYCSSKLLLRSAQQISVTYRIDGPPARWRMLPAVITQQLAYFSTSCICDATLCHDALDLSTSRRVCFHKFRPWTVLKALRQRKQSLSSCCNLGRSAVLHCKGSTILYTMQLDTQKTIAGAHKLVSACHRCRCTMCVVGVTACSRMISLRLVGWPKLCNHHLLLYNHTQAHVLVTCKPNWAVSRLYYL